MDYVNLIQFLSCLSGYYIVGDLFDEINIENFLCSEIGEKDLYVACSIFGAFFPDNDTIMLAPVKSLNYNIPIRNSFEIRIDENVDGEESVHCVHLKAI